MCDGGGSEEHERNLTPTNKRIGGPVNASVVPVEEQGVGKRRRLLTPAETTLGKWAQDADDQIKILGWKGFVDTVRGQSNMTGTVGQIPHRAARALNHLR